MSPNILAWPYTERNGTRGQLILANTGLGVDTWRLHSLQNFARQVRDLSLGPHVVIGGSAFVFSDMISMMRDGGPRATLGLCWLCLRRTTLAWDETARNSGIGECHPRHYGNAKRCMPLGNQGRFPRFCGAADKYWCWCGLCGEYRSTSPTIIAPNGGRAAALTSGPVIILCSYTTTIGYASLLFSLNRGIHTFGLCAMIGELTCLAAAMIFAPAFLDWGQCSKRNFVTPVDTTAAITGE